MARQTYILKPIIKKTGTTASYDAYTCVDFALFCKGKMVDDGFNCFAGLPINSVAKSKKAFNNIDLSGEISEAIHHFTIFCRHFLNGTFNTKCIGNKFIFTVKIN